MSDQVQITINDLPKHEKKVARAAMKAIATNRVLDLQYDGDSRLVEVHAVGISTAGKPCMRVYQVQGGSQSLVKEGWKLLSLAKVFDTPKIVDIVSLAPRKGFSKGDAGMQTIFTEV